VKTAAFELVPVHRYKYSRTRTTVAALLDTSIAFDSKKEINK
jgi:hypothetical protein